MPTEKYYHSEVKEIMITKPSWILKWGNVIIMGLLLLVLAFAAFFTYPESITTDITLTAVHPLETVQPRAGNQGIQALLVPDGALVRPGTPLVAWYDEGQADYREVLQLEKLLLDYASQPQAPEQPQANQQLLRRFFHLDTLKLGSLRPAYQTLNRQLLGHSALSAAAAAQGLRQVAAWKKQFISVAQSTGQARLNYLAPRTATPLPVTQAVVYVQPPNAEFIAQGYVSNQQYGAVASGQEVFISVAELGAARLEGRVLGVAPLAEHNRHRVFVRLLAPAPGGLNATFSGNARIVLHKRPLLTKFFSGKS